jgi:hypothetical protein
VVSTDRPLNTLHFSPNLLAKEKKQYNPFYMKFIVVDVSQEEKPGVTCAKNL